MQHSYVKPPPKGKIYCCGVNSIHNCSSSRCLAIFHCIEIARISLHRKDVHVSMFIRMCFKSVLWADIKSMICNLLGVLFKLLLSPSIVCFLYLSRKSFGATLVKRVRKAGSDFMSKVPRVSTQVMELCVFLWMSECCNVLVMGPNGKNKT